MSLEDQFPLIEWREPLAVQGRSKSGKTIQRWACRLCIAEKSLKGDEVDTLYIAREDALEHIRHHIARR